MPKDTNNKNTEVAKDAKDAKDIKESKVKHNQATNKAGLSFNVNTTKNWIKKQMEVQDVEVMPKFSGAHVALTAIIESLLMSVIGHVNSQLPKDKSSLYKITLPVLSYNLQLDDNFGKLFRDSFSTYDGDTNYGESFWISKNDITTFIESHWSDNIQLDVKAYNQLAYLLMRYAIVIIKTSYYLMSYAGKKTLEPKSLRAAVLIHTPQTIANTILIKLDDAVKNTPTEDVDAEENDSNEKEENKSKGGKKKSTKKVSKEEEEEEEDDDKDEDDEENDSDKEEEENKSSKESKKKVIKKESDDDESDPEPEPEPKNKKKGKPAKK